MAVFTPEDGQCLDEQVVLVRKRDVHDFGRKSRLILSVGAGVHLNAIFPPLNMTYFSMTFQNCFVFVVF